MLKNKTNITAKKNITILNNDTEYNELHAEVFGLDNSGGGPLLWYCEGSIHFDDDVMAYGWQR